MSHTATKIIRYNVCALFVWFGIAQLMDPGAWVTFLPEWTGYLPIPGDMLVQLNAWSELVLATLLLVGVYTRWIGLYFAMHLAMIAATVGGAIGVRDLSLGIMCLVLFFTPPDEWTVDARQK